MWLRSRRNVVMVMAELDFKLVIKFRSFRSLRLSSLGGQWLRTGSHSGSVSVDLRALWWWQGLK